MSEKQVVAAFRDPPNLKDFDSEKLVEYLKTNIYYTLEDRFMESETKDPQEKYNQDLQEKEK